jgi:hypothetical protein
MFSCRDATHLHTEAREGALEGWTATKYRMHMAVCFYCKRCRRQLDEAIALAHDIPTEEVPGEVEEKALAAFRARRE